MKRILAICLAALIASLCAAALAESSATLAPDVAFAREVTRTIASLGDNPDVGNRSSGSAAERQAAEFIRQTMEEIGLTEDLIPLSAALSPYVRSRLTVMRILKLLDFTL